MAVVLNSTLFLTPVGIQLVSQVLLTACTKCFQIGPFLSPPLLWFLSSLILGYCNSSHPGLPCLISLHSLWHPVTLSPFRMYTPSTHRAACTPLHMLCFAWNALFANSSLPFRTKVRDPLLHKAFHFSGTPDLELAVLGRAGCTQCCEEPRSSLRTS